MVGSGEVIGKLHMSRDSDAVLNHGDKPFGE
jgi:hypothetical protein